MSEEIKTQETSDKVAAAVAQTVYGSGDDKRGGGRRNGGGANRGRDNRRGGARGQDEFDQKMLDVARVTRVVQGGKRMSFRACVALGDKKGKIGMGLGKGADVTLAVNKAVNQAKKNMVNINLSGDTIPHEVYKEMGASRILFKPAKPGSGVKAGGVVRLILELVGIKNVTSKILGGGNKINNARCTISALESLHKVNRPEKKKTAEVEIKE